MYCVRCGVRLQDGTEFCPLCQTPVWNPGADRPEPGFPESLPPRHRESTLPGAIAMTVVSVLALAVTVIVCLHLYGALRWGGYVLGGILLFDIVAVLPLWFEEPRGEVFVPVDFLAAGLYVLYICRATHGHWFLSFAFPVILAAGLLTTAMVCLLKYVRGGRIFIFGGFLVLLGGYAVLVEFFEHLTFGMRMFTWSQYPLAGFGIVGLFLLIAGTIPPLREEIRRRFFF